MNMYIAHLWVFVSKVLIWKKKFFERSMLKKKKNSRIVRDGIQNFKWLILIYIKSWIKILDSSNIKVKGNNDFFKYASLERSGVTVTKVGE